MKNYAEFEAKVLRQVRRGFTGPIEAMNECYGYLYCMIDMGMFTKDRPSEEYKITVKKILEAEQEHIKARDKEGGVN